MAVAPELLAIVEALLDLGVDLKKGSKSGNVLSSILSDQDLVAKLEVVFSKLSSLSSDVKSLSLVDAPELLGVVINGAEKIIAA